MDTYYLMNEFCNFTDFRRRRSVLGWYNSKFIIKRQKLRLSFFFYFSSQCAAASLLWKFLSECRVFNGRHSHRESSMLKLITLALCSYVCSVTPLLLFTFPLKPTSIVIKNFSGW